MGKDKNIRSLYVRPVQSADLAFSSAGILAKQNSAHARLGKKATEVDVNFLTSKLGEIDEDGRLIYNAEKIRTELEKHSLFILKNELLVANLEQAIAQRDLMYFQRFKHKDGIVESTQEVYLKKDGSNKIDRLQDLQTKWNDRSKILSDIYDKTEIKGYKENEVIRETETTTSYSGNIAAKTMLTPTGVLVNKHTTNVMDQNDNTVSRHRIDEVTTVPIAWSTEGKRWSQLTDDRLGFESQDTTTYNNTTQTSKTMSLEFAQPWYDNKMRNLRAQLDLQDEWLAQKLLTLQAIEMRNIMDKKQRILDLEVLKAQLLYIETFLLPPITGVVTAVYKDVGEAVQPGEPIIRIENDTTLLLVGLIRVRSGIRVGTKVEVHAESIFESGKEVSLNGEIVSVRGHNADDDEWDLVIECQNTEKLPINYHFDRDTTSFEIVQ